MMLAPNSSVGIEHLTRDSRGLGLKPSLVRHVFSHPVIYLLRIIDFNFLRPPIFTSTDPPYCLDCLSIRMECMASIRMLITSCHLMEFAVFLISYAKQTLKQVTV